MKKHFSRWLLLGGVLAVAAIPASHAVESKKEKQVASKKTSASQPVKQTAKSDSSKRQVAKGPQAKGQSVAAKGRPLPVASKNVSSKQAAANKSQLIKTAAAQPTVRKTIPKIVMEDLDPSHLGLHSASALVIDQQTGQAVLEKHPDAVTPIASISKLMTAMVVLDAKQDLQEIVTVTDDDVDSLKGTRSRLPVGTSMTRETAMLLALMSSENRAANALGRHYPGGLSAFVVAMNRKAKSLGMMNTRFEEPTGLSSNNVSTAHDLAKMVSAAARYPEIRQYSTTAEARVELNGRVRDFGNTNALVRNEQWEIGVSKTGYISEAGRCLVMQARVADKPVVIVLLDSVGKMTRVGDAIRIKRWMENTTASSAMRRS